MRRENSALQTSREFVPGRNLSPIDDSGVAAGGNPPCVQKLNQSPQPDSRQRRRHQNVQTQI